MRLIAIPFAAGTAYAFRQIQKHLNPSVQLDVFEYPGHGQKLCAQVLNSIPEIAQEMRKEMFPISEPYCLLGYSMGGHVLCELYRQLIENHYPLPIHVFLCAIDIPNQHEEEESDTSDQKLTEELMELGGTEPEILENPEFMEMLLPIYRADILAERSYVLPYEQLFRCKGTVIYGKEELKEERHFSEWQRYFLEPIQFREVCGGHFFMQETPQTLVDIINQTIEKMD